MYVEVNRHTGEKKMYPDLAAFLRRLLFLRLTPTDVMQVVNAGAVYEARHAWLRAWRLNADSNINTCSLLQHVPSERSDDGSKVLAR